MAVKLSRSIEDIRSELFARVEAVQDEYSEKGWLPIRLNLNKGIVRGILEMFAWGQWQLYNFLDLVHRQAIPLDSTGKWLDLHCSQIDLYRRPAVKARGLVLFYRGNARGNIRIPAGRILRTAPDGAGMIYRYITEENAVLSSDSDSVAVPVIAEEYGQGSNATAGQICELVTPVAGIGSVSNLSYWLVEEGSDEETDVALRRRYVLEWQSKAGNTRAAYEKAAWSVPGVMAVYVSDQHPRGEGTVDVVIQGAAGIPTANLLQQVMEALDDAIVINHDLEVKGPRPVRVAVDCVIEILAGDQKAILQDAENAIRKMFSSTAEDELPRFSLGRDVIRDRLASAIINIPNIKRIRWKSPASDIVIEPDQLPVLDSLKLAVDWVNEP